MIYLDHNATTPIFPACVAAMTQTCADHWANPSSVHRAGQAARAALDRARKSVARLVGVEARALVFTSGATEANQIALTGVCRASRSLLVTSAIEHPSVVSLARALEEQGTELRWLDPDPTGRISPAALDAALADRGEFDQVLASVMWVQNETGTVNPIAELARVARRRRALFHTDATQAVGRLDVDFVDVGVELATFSAHKLGGPRGVGALYVQRGLELTPLFRGGHQERGKRPGTENLPGIVGFGVAAEEHLAAPGSWETVRALGAEFAFGLASALPDSVRLGDPHDHIGNTFCVAFRGLEAGDLLIALDLAGIAASAGSACSSGSIEPSPTIRALTADPEIANGAIRFSLGRTTTAREVQEAVKIIAREVTHMRASHAAAGSGGGGW